MQDKVVLITGGSRGIGKATAESLLRAGANVTITGRHQDAGDDALKELEGLGGEVHFVLGDVANEADIEKMVGETVDRFGRLDGAFNNAGIGDFAGRLHETSTESFTPMFEVNVRGTFLSMKYELIQFLKQAEEGTGKGGSIVNCSSVQAHVALPMSGHYTATKHAIEGYTKMAALEYAEDGIRINAVAPAVIEDGRLGGGDAPQEVRDWLLAMHPLGRFGLGKDVAGAVKFLLSDEADFCTGSVLFVDGGFMAK